MKRKTITYTKQQYEQIINYFTTNHNNGVPAIAAALQLDKRVVQKAINEYLKQRYYV